MTHTRSSLRRRAALGVTAAVVALTASIAGAGSASAAPKAAPKITVKVSAASVVAGQNVTLAGKASKVKAPAKITISRKVGSAWRAVKTMRTAKNGKFSYRFVPPAGRQSYRVRLTATKKLKAATSKVVTVTVTRPPVVVPPSPPVVPPEPPVEPPVEAPVVLPDDLMTLVSPGLEGESADGSSYEPSISANGRYIAFQSTATNLVPGGGIGYMRIYVLDRVTGDTTVLTDGTNGSPILGTHPSISADGQHVAYVGPAPELVEAEDPSAVFVWDRSSGRSTPVSTVAGEAHANGTSLDPDISGDGNVVTFTSYASNLVPSDGNGAEDVFVWNRDSGLRLVSASEAGVAGNSASNSASISDDGRYVTFLSNATDLAAPGSVYYTTALLWDRETGETTAVSHDAQGGALEDAVVDATISGDASRVVYSTLGFRDDSTLETDLWSWDRVADTPEHIALRPGGESLDRGIGSLTVSSDGDVVGFAASTADFIDETSPDASDVFVWRRQTGATTLVSTTPAGAQAAAGGVDIAVSGDGKWAAFSSYSNDVVAGDTNGTYDVFVRNLLATP